MHKNSTFGGLDVSKAKVVAALLLSGTGELREAQFPHTGKGIDKLERWVRRESDGEVLCCYEAGPCGYVLQRRLRSAGIECQVVAPSLIPTRPGDRIKTDRRDAKKLATLLAGGLLTEVHPPTEEEEAVRDLCRCRGDARRALHSARQQLLKFLLRRNCRFDGSNWSQAHWVWLRGLEFEYPAAQRTFEDYVLTVEHAQIRLGELDRELEALAQREPYREAVGVLRCFRGIDTVSAIVILGELYCFRRFESPRDLMAYIGLVPSEYSSGDVERRGPITKAGNCHVRRVLVEAAWNYRYKPAIGPKLRKRREGQPAQVIACANHAMVRLHRRYLRLINVGKVPQKAVVALARELVGFLWSVLRPDRPAAHGACLS